MGATTPPYIAMTKALYIVLLGFLGFGSSTFEQDKAECGDKLVGLAACLSFVGGKASSPPPDCCNGLKQVVERSTKCVCVLIKDRNDPKLGIKFNITRTLQLPSTCHVPLNVTTCVELLHLAPNSTDAKMFEDFEKSLTPASRSAGAGNSTIHGSTTTANNGGKGKRWNDDSVIMGVLEMAFGTYLLLLFFQY